MERTATQTIPLARDMVTIACPQCGGQASIEWSAPPVDGPGNERIDIRCITRGCSNRMSTDG